MALLVVSMDAALASSDLEPDSAKSCSQESFTACLPKILYTCSLFMAKDKRGGRDLDDFGSLGMSLPGSRHISGWRFY